MCVCLHSFWLLHKNILTSCGLSISKTCCSFLNCYNGQTSGHPLQQTNSAPHIRSRLVSSIPNTPQPVGSRFKLMFFHPHQLSREVSFISRILCGLKKMPEFIAASLQLGNLLFLTNLNVEKVCSLSDPRRITSDGKSSRCFSSDINHSCQSKDFHKLHIKRTSRALKCQLFGFQSATVKHQLFARLSQLQTF